MRQTQPISPGITTLETDISDKSSIYSKPSTINGSTSSGEAEGSGSQGNIIVSDFILQENGYRLLQEDNNKIII